MTANRTQAQAGPDELLTRLLERLDNRDQGNGAAPIDRAGTRKRILDAAIEIAAARGFEALTVREVAAAAGVKPPALYSHFSSKEAILSEAMMRALADFLAYATTPSEATTPTAQLEEAVHRHVLYQLQHLSLTRANDLLLNAESLDKFLPAEEHELLVGVQRVYYKLLRNRVEAVLPESSTIDRRVATFAIINMCDRVTTWYRPGAGLAPEDVAEQYWGLVQGMLSLPR